MTYTVIFSERAEKELRDAWSWYEDRQIGLGDRFLSEITYRIKQIETDPSKGHSHKRSYFEILLQTFPYMVIYRIDKKLKVIFISSIFHTSRNPKKKYK